MDRSEALELARSRLFALRALSPEALRDRADEAQIHQEEAGSGAVHCHLLIIRYEWTGDEGRPAVRVSVNVEDGGFPVLDPDEVSFVRPMPDAVGGSS